MRGASLALLLLAGSAAAQDLPALHDVAGVASDDVLNIRSEPSASAPIIGGLAPDAQRVEVTEVSGNGWGQVNSGEGRGWVSMRFLKRADTAAWHEAGATLACFGTEPFWAFDIGGGTGRFSSPSADGIEYAVTDRAIPIGGPLTLGLGLDRGFAVIEAQSCSDGMSDRAFGLSISLFLDQDGELRPFKGCCSLSP